MSRFGKNKEDQLLYKCSQLERQNEELVDRINKELVPGLKTLDINNRYLSKAIELALRLCGGRVEFNSEEFYAPLGMWNLEEDITKKTTIFYIVDEKETT